jgi:hypothetical protein
MLTKRLWPSSANPEDIGFTALWCLSEAFRGGESFSLKGSHELNQVGPIHMTTEKAKTLLLTPIVGSIFLVGGIVFWSSERENADGRQTVSIMEVIMEDKRKAYEERLDAQLKEWNAQIALLKARAENAKADAKVDYYKTIEAFEHKQDKAKTKLQELKTAGDEAWDAVKTGAEKAWAEVKTAYHDAVSKFK